MARNYRVKMEKNNLKKASRELPKAMERALTTGALIVQGEAIVRVPVDTGNLRSSLTYQVGKDDATIGTNVEYAASVELGLSKQRPQPYLRPALTQNKGRIEKAMAGVLKKGIEGAAR